jgi:hypothetical protein
MHQREKFVLGKNPDEAGFSGILVDKVDGRLAIKAISAHTAWLFEALAAPLPRASLPAGEDPLDDTTLIQMVLEGILEINHGGSFVSGCAAAPFFVKGTSSLCERSALGDLSRAALLHAQRLAIADPKQLAARIYFYNRAPLSARWAHQWPDQRAILEYLGVLRNLSSGPRSLPGQFTAVALEQDSAWISWRRDQEALNMESLEEGRFKLYVSPKAEHLRSAFDAIVSLLPTSDVISLKIGATASGLLRPDKAVIYFRNYSSLAVFAKSLMPLVTNVAAQGVPFSASLDESGLLSWGIDPKWAQGGIGWFADNSWRIWVCNRLAASIVEAKQSSICDIEPWEFAVTKAWYSGIDTRTWGERQAYENH